MPWPKQTRERIMNSQTLTKKQVAAILSTELKKFYLELQILSFTIICMILANLIFPAFTMITTTIIGGFGLTYIYIIYKRIISLVHNYQEKYEVD